MSAPVSLASVRERAIRLERSAWLASPVDALTRGVADAELSAIVGFVAEKLKLRTIDDLLGSAEAERAFQRALDPATRVRMFEAVDAFLRSSESHPTRIAPLDDGVRVPEPPRVASQLVEWTRERGIEDRLDRPASVVLPFVESGSHLTKHPFDAGATVHDVLHRRRLPSSGTSASSLTEAARLYLAHEATRAAEEKARLERWQSSPDTVALRRADAELGACYEALEARASLERPFHDRLRELSIDPVASALEAHFDPPSRAESRRAMKAAVGLLPGAKQASCDCAAFRDVGACPHALRVVAEARDVLHRPDHPLRSSFVAMLDAPTWSSLTDAVETAVAATTNRPERRLVFRLAPDDADQPVVPLVQRRHRDGGYSAGAAVAFSRVPDEVPGLDASELSIVALGMASADAATRATYRLALLRQLARHGSILDPDDARRTVPLVERRIAVVISLADEGAELHLAIDGEPIDPAAVQHGSALLRFRENPRGYELAEVDPRLRPIATALVRERATLPRTMAEAIADRLVQLQPAVPLVLPEELAGTRLPVDERPVVQLSPLGDGGLRVRVAVRPLPEGPALAPGDGPPLLVGLRDGARVHVVRDPAAEIEGAHRVFAELELEAGVEEAPHLVRFDGVEDALPLVERIGKLGDSIRVEWPKGASALRLVRARSGSPSVRVRTAARWLGVEGELETDEGKIPLALLVRAVRDGKRYVALRDGAFLRIEDALRERLSAVTDGLFDTDDGLALAHANAAMLEQLADSNELELDVAARSWKERMESARTADVLPSSELAGVLRSYQNEGFAWMSRLSAMGLGCLLADEMGLGKTLQSLALLGSRSALGPALVVTPTSVTEAWSKECLKFTPSLVPHVHIGQRRSTAIATLGPGDVLITSYDVLVRDIDAIRGVSFATAIFDEAHLLKNAKTRRSEAARAIVADARIALTGTPVENHLGDLFGIFDVISPGLLGSWAHFRDRYATPIERHGDASRRQALRTLVTPYVLRRTKAEVAIELPSRIEVETGVDLSPEESLLYEAARREAVADLQKAGGTLAQRRFAVLAAITRLRQLACHPRLVDPASEVPSSKLATFIELATDLVREGHRTLVFSQFVRHLDLVRDALDAAGFESLRLDGSTPARERTRLVESFQGGKAPFFLISLKAGGTGLNLTAADYVVHLDPWWNPAVEDQASDRAHRIGQTQPVTIVRLVANDTIERAVLKLHAEKRALADALLAESSKIGKADVEELFALLTD